MHRIRFHPEAVEEAAAARAWYLGRSEVAAEGFLRALEEAVVEIAEAPDRYPADDEGVRRRLLSPFPLALVYRVREETVEVLALAHGARRPGYWRER